ncbi:MAG: hypothetical protein IJE07_05470 [Clostridia bacterium]|nr:hypothetical protein [Clostridia bacterium]
MEELAGLIPVFIIAIISIISKANAKNKKAQQHTNQSFIAARPPQAQPAAKPAITPPAPVTAPPVPRTAAQPTVHTHYQPDCETHDAPGGSLNAQSTEGKDPCHEQQLPPRRTAVQEAPAERPGLTLDWSADAMVRAFVMQEVLTRPCQRRR